MEIIDAHQHFWELDQPFDYGWLQVSQHAPICRDYLPEDLRPHLERTGVRKTVFVQTQHDLRENRWALALAERNEWIAGIVGWIDLTSPECERQLQEFKDNPLFVGVRHITQDEPDDNFIIRDDVLRGLAVLSRHRMPFDLLFYVKHLRHAAELGKRFPDLPMVIDHLAKPRIKDHSIDGWLPDLKAASTFPNIFCKLSGLVTEANWRQWTVNDRRPYVEQAVELFGPERCMFGSDWPVCELAGSYEQVYAAIREILEPLSPNERDMIFGQTARRFYRLTR